MSSSVKAKCRECGNMAPADQFKLHYEKRSMVCPSCYKGKPALKNEVKKKEEKIKRPAGWDEVDEYLEKFDSRKKNVDQRGEFTRIPGTQQVHYKCFSCKYQFRYDPFRKLPRTCPYCNNDIPKLRTFGLL